MQIKMFLSSNISYMAMSICPRQGTAGIAGYYLLLHRFLSPISHLPLPFPPVAIVKVSPQVTKRSSYPRFDT